MSRILTSKNRLTSILPTSVLIVAMTFSWPLAADDRADCEKRTRVSAAACTRLLKASGLDAEELLQLHALRGAAYRQIGKYDDSISDFTHAIGLAKKLELPRIASDAHLLRGAVHSLKDDLRAALADFEEAVALEPNNDEAHSAVQRTRASLQAKEMLAKAPPVLNAPHCFTFNNERFCD